MMTGRTDDTAYRVMVSEQRSRSLTGLSDCRYASPRHSAPQARALLRVLLGRDPAAGETTWLVALAGGRQRIDLVEEVDDA